MKWIFTHFKSMEPQAHVMSNEALNHIGEKNIECPSMVVFLNMLLLKYYHAHNIHRCPFYLISNIRLGFCYSILEGKFLFIFNILGRKLAERK